MATFLSANIVQQAPPEGGATTRRRLLGGSAALAGAGALGAVPPLASAAGGGPTATVNAGAFCTKTGACPCDDPCIWGRQAIDGLRRDGWPAVENSTAPDAELIEILGEAGRVA